MCQSRITYFLKYYILDFPNVHDLQTKASFAYRLTIANSLEPSFKHLNRRQDAVVSQYNSLLNQCNQSCHFS